MSEIEKLSKNLLQIIDKRLETSDLIEQVRNLLREFGGNTLWLREFIESKLFDNEFFLSQLNSIWPNEITLFRSPDNEFTILGYFWGPHFCDTIHDHGSWGVIAPFILPVGERKFKRLDDGKIDGYARLEKISYKTINPGETTYVLPLNDGIHQMENTTEKYLISLNIYGRSLRRGYVQFFDQDKRKVWHSFPPRTQKQLMIIQAMGNITESWTEKLLTDAAGKDLPDFIKEQCQLSLHQLNSQK